MASARVLRGSAEDIQDARETLLLAQGIYEQLKEWRRVEELDTMRTKLASGQKVGDASIFR